ncbi:hypothetical protein HMPREF0063_12623 [Aeromicrobium marinum DSM 15272]|uniref:DUF4229 domain-containing protein n=1 Tax=Aeromicrobium marinum DSM 15272 TaxID=585531 RepID=E2SF14_9ACTN|nr:DUF4229 domain-containing protein [Aeromicrobium marinum]EFQ82258.1 hypothetical protein HMPREF0063_12623 [Aeromicrobium marinum DSM 15272]
MKALWTYTLARLGIFVLTYAVVWAVCWTWVERSELTNLVILFVSLVISAIISIRALSGLRENLAADIARKAEQVNSRIEESRRAEDVD